MNRILIAATAITAVPALAQTSLPQPPQTSTVSADPAPSMTPVAPSSSAPHRHKPSPSELRVRAANAKATQEPVSPAFVNAVQVYPYGEGVLYRLFAAPERVTDIALHPARQSSRSPPGTQRDGPSATRPVAPATASASIFW